MTESTPEFATVPLEQALTYAAYVDLDVRADTIAVAVILPGQKAAEQRTEIPCQAATLRTLVQNLRQRFGDQRILWTCEAGRRGYFIYRQLTAQGQDCQLVAPGMMATDSQQHVARRDASDAARLAKLSSGACEA